MRYTECISYVHSVLEHILFRNKMYLQYTYSISTLTPCFEEPKFVQGMVNAAQCIPWKICLKS